MFPNSVLFREVQKAAHSFQKQKEIKLKFVIPYVYGLKGGPGFTCNTYNNMKKLNLERYR